jgi:hypothetical protein
VVICSGGYDRVDMDRLLEGIQDWEFGQELAQHGAPLELTSITH